MSYDDRMKQQPLKGVTVLDFGQVYNGPYCGFLLAQSGARVIKVESLLGETLRARGNASPASYPFANLNTNKECITLNIKTPQARDVIRAARLRSDPCTLLGELDRHRTRFQRPEKWQATG